MEEIGPSIDFSLRRTRFAADDLAKSALKTPKQLKPTKVKNISHTPLKETVGQLHMEKQELGKLQIRKIKGLKKRKEAPEADPDAPKNDGGRKKPRLTPKKKHSGMALDN